MMLAGANGEARTDYHTVLSAMRTMAKRIPCDRVAAAFQPHPAAWFEETIGQTVARMPDST